MATYQQIQSYVKNRYGFQPKPCWIAHVKELAGLPVRHAWNREGEVRKEPCPPEKVEPIRSALRHFDMLYG